MTLPALAKRRHRCLASLRIGPGAGGEKPPGVFFICAKAGRVERGHHRVYSALIALYCLDFFGFLRGKWGRFSRKLYGLSAVFLDSDNRNDRASIAFHKVWSVK
jgi:hypothetical protein